MGNAQTNSKKRQKLRRRLTAEGWSKAQIDNEFDARGITPTPPAAAKAKVPYQPPSPRPKPCTKTRYRDSVAAMLAAANIQARGSDRNGKTPWRTYRCPRCNGWHLTSQRRAQEAPRV